MSQNYFFRIIVFLGMIFSIFSFAAEPLDNPVSTAPKAPVARKTLPLRLDQPTKTERTRLPVTGGIPFPKGELLSEDNLRAFDAAGKEIPSQARCLNRWPDNSIKVMLLDFQADIPQTGDASCAIEYGSAVKSQARDSGIQIKKDDAQISVDTGAMKFSISKTGCGWMDEIEVGGQSVGKGINYARFKGDVEINKTVVSNITVEDGADIPNPLRAVIKVEGTYVSILYPSSK